MVVPGPVLSWAWLHFSVSTCRASRSPASPTTSCSTAWSRTRRRPRKPASTSSRRWTPSIRDAAAVPRGGHKILVGGGGEARTRRILAKHGDIGHWFGGNLEDLKRKKKVFEEHCAAVDRDPSEVLLTVGMPLVLVDNEKDGAAIVASLPPERRRIVMVVRVPQAVEGIDDYLAAGFGGFTS